MMTDFNYIPDVSKEERIRAYSMEQAVEALGHGAGIDISHYVKAAEQIETFILNGGTKDQK